MQYLNKPVHILCGVLSALLLIVFCAMDVHAQSERGLGVDGPLDEAWDLVKGATSTNMDKIITLGGTWGSDMTSSFNSNPPNAYVTISDDLGSPLQTTMYDVELWDRGAGLVELSDATGFVWVSGGRNPNNGSFDIIVVYQQQTGSIPANPLMRFFGGNLEDGATDIIEVNDGTGEILICGSTRSYGVGNKDGIVMRIDPKTMNVIWTRTFSGSGFDRNDEFTALKQADANFDNPGHVYLAGTSNSWSSNNAYDMWFVEIDPNRFGPILQGSRIFGGSTNERAHGLETQSYLVGQNWVNRVVASGETYSYSTSKSDACLLNFDEYFNGQWATRYDFNNSSPEGWDVAYDVVKTVAYNGEIVVVGQINNPLVPNGAGFGMRIPVTGGAPSLPFELYYGDVNGYNTLRALYNTNHAVKPYAAAGRTDRNEAGDKYLLLLGPHGQSGQQAMADCATSISPSAYALTPTLSQVTVNLATPFLGNGQVLLNSISIGREVFYCHQ